MSLYDEDPGAKAPEPEPAPEPAAEASGDGEIVVPDYEAASAAPASAASAGVVGAPAGVGPLDKLNCMATVVPAPNAVNKVAAAELALLQTRMFNITWWCAQLLRLSGVGAALRSSSSSHRVLTLRARCCRGAIVVILHEIFNMTVLKGWNESYSFWDDTFAAFCKL